MRHEMTYVSFSQGRNPELFPGLVALYRDVFAGEPWNEWKRCSVCNQQWGIKQRQYLKEHGYIHCGKLVVDFWPAELVKNDIVKELATKGSSCCLAIELNPQGDRIVGFCWGYPITPEGLENKLGFNGLANIIRLEFGRQLEHIAYQDEIGVWSGYRLRGIGKKMFRFRLLDFQDMKLSVGVIRTKTIPPTVTYKWYQRLGYNVIAKYNDQIGRVIMARTLGDLEL